MLTAWFVSTWLGITLLVINLTEPVLDLNGNCSRTRFVTSFLKNMRRTYCFRPSTVTSIMFKFPKGCPQSSVVINDQFQSSYRTCSSVRSSNLTCCHSVVISEWFIDFRKLYRDLQAVGRISFMPFYSSIRNFFTKFLQTPLTFYIMVIFCRSRSSTGSAFWLIRKMNYLHDCF